MTSLYVFAALACLLVEHAIATVELTDATFFDYAKDKDVLLAYFYAPWCPDCKALDPDFESAAESLGKRSLDLARIDCFGAGKGLCATYGIKQWPTLKNFNKGTFTGDYNGGLTSSEIAGYITTVENSVAPNSNPYAMVVPQPIQQACISRCKVAKVPNNHNCFTKCKDKPFSTHNGAKKLMNMKMIAPKPVINEKSCAKCRIPQPAGRSKCTKEAILLCNDLEKTLRAARETVQAASVDQSSNEMQTKETTPQAEDDKKLADQIPVKSKKSEETNRTLLDQENSNKTSSASAEEVKGEKNDSKITKITIGKSRAESKKTLKTAHKILPKQFKGVKTEHVKKDLDAVDYMKLVKNGKLQKTLEMMSPREALRVPYAKDDK